MNLPPTTLLGSAIEVSPIPLRNVPSLAPEPLAAPCNLLIENLPSDLSSDVIKMQLTFMFKNIKHEMLECVVEGNCAYCKFKDAKCKYYRQVINRSIKMIIDSFLFS